MSRKMFWLAAMAFALLASCGGGGSEAKKEEPAAKPAASAPLDTANAGTITGKISFTGAKPERRAISMDATPSCARQHTGTIYSEEVIVNSNGTLKNVLVRIKEGLPQREWPIPPAAKLDQKGCIYTPHVLAVMVNQPIEISNSDDTNHNIHPLPRTNREWNESQPPKGDVKTKSFPKEEMPAILFKCNVHPWMRAWVGVIAHPYFAVSGDDGTFTLKDVPPGDYTIEAWHEKYGVQEIKVKVEPKGSATADLTYKG